MSVHHPTISLWQRSHEGAYQAEVSGHQLKVSWTPNAEGRRGSFFWEASVEGAEHHSEHHFEEMEEAMADAETFARDHAAHRAAQIAQAADQ
jgi:hypothetical protein